MLDGVHAKTMTSPALNSVPVRGTVISVATNRTWLLMSLTVRTRISVIVYMDHCVQTSGLLCDFDFGRLIGYIELENVNRNSMNII